MVCIDLCVELSWSVYRSEVDGAQLGAQRSQSLTEAAGSSRREAPYEGELGRRGGVVGVDDSPSSRTAVRGLRIKSLQLCDSMPRSV